MNAMLHKLLLGGCVPYFDLPIVVTRGNLSSIWGGNKHINTVCAMSGEFCCLLKALQGEHVDFSLLVSNPNLTCCLYKSQTDAIISNGHGSLEREGVGVNLDDLLSVR